MIQNKIVVRYLDGRILKGYTGDFLPTKPVFHLALFDAPANSKPTQVQIAELKAVFFVKNLSGNPDHSEELEFTPGRPVIGRKIRVVFKDGEVLVGTTQGYDPSRVGFFLIPVDTQSNNERCFVVRNATVNVSFL